MIAFSIVASLLEWILIFFVFIYYLKGKLTGKMREEAREIFRLLVHFPNDCNNQSWFGLKAGDSSGCCNEVQGSKDLGYFSLLSQAYQQGVGPVLEQQGLAMMSKWDAGSAGRVLTYYNHSIETLGS